MHTRVYTAAWKVDRVHGDAFDSIPPATSMVEVSRLVDSALLVEIEANAVVP